MSKFMEKSVLMIFNEQMKNNYFKHLNLHSIAVFRHSEYAHAKGVSGLQRSLPCREREKSLLIFYYDNMVQMLLFAFQRSQTKR